MKRVCILALISSVSGVASATSDTSSLRWNDLSETSVVTLTTTLFLPFHDGDPHGIRLNPGTALRFHERTPLGGIGVTQFELVPALCRAPAETTTMVVVGPKGTEVGVQIEAGCRFELYVEDRDLYRNSFFTVTR